MSELGYEVRPAGEKGIGVFARVSFKKGDQVYLYPKGKIMTAVDAQTLPEEEKRFVDSIGEGLYELIEPPARYLNHSCEPNIEERERVGYATRAIASGEELTLDYDRVAFLEEPLRCLCGSTVCRGKVVGRT